MKVIFKEEEDQCGTDQWGPGLGYLQRNGFNFLPVIVKLEELLIGVPNIHECVTDDTQICKKEVK